MPDIKIIFRGDEFTIPESRAFEIGERIEDIATLPEIIGWARKPKFFKMARCFGEMLRAAGGRATDRDVHTAMMADFGAGNPGAYFGALNSLLTVLMDGAPQGKGDPDEGKPTAS